MLDSVADIGQTAEGHSRVVRPCAVAPVAVILELDRHIVVNRRPCKHPLLKPRCIDRKRLHRRARRPFRIGRIALQPISRLISDIPRDPEDRTRIRVNDYNGTSSLSVIFGEIRLV